MIFLGVSILILFQISRIPPPPYIYIHTHDTYIYFTFLSLHVFVVIFYLYVLRRLLFTDPPTVKSLVVNENEANSSHIINEGRIQVICSFDKGNPPSNFLLLDGHRKEMKAYKVEEYLNYSFNVRCKDDWPTIRCEGSGSKNNRSVKFLVKCKQKVNTKFFN